MIDVYPKIKGACIPNGRAPIVPTDRFDETREEMASYKSTADSRIYLHVARCHPVKNQMLLAEAFGKFVEKGYHADLVIIGSGFESKLGESIRREPGNNVHFIGTRKNVGDYMLHADAFCLSSDFEGLPITILEASLAGLPIVSTTVCGAVDIIENKVNGVLSEGHSIGEYLDALEYSYQHLCELRQNSQRMKDDSAYTIENCARKYMDFFNR
jgi:glycosyltransferase involved in cell wall biosynthesis